MFQKMEQLIPEKISNYNGNETNGRKAPESAVLIVSQTVAANGKHGCSQEAADSGNDKKHPRPHVAQSHDIAEGVLGESGNEKQDKGDELPLVCHEVIVFLKDRRTDRLLHKGKSEPPGQGEGKPGTDGEPNGRIQRPQDGPVDITADESRRFSGNGSEKHLEDLEADKDHHRQGSEGIDKLDGLMPVREELDKIVMDKEPGSAAKKNGRTDNF